MIKNRQKGKERDDYKQVINRQPNVKIVFPKQQDGRYAETRRRPFTAVWASVMYPMGTIGVVYCWAWEGKAETEIVTYT